MSEHFDQAALSQILSTIDPAFSDPASLEVKQFSGGASNLTARVTSGEKTLVVRRAPPGKKAATAHDMAREARVLKAIKPHFKMVPEVFHIEEDSEVLGTPFFVMEHLNGHVPSSKMPVKITPEQAKKLCENLVDLQADIHSLDLEATGLSNLGKPEGYVQRQIEGWSQRYRDARTEDVPRAERVMEWLEKNRPNEVGASLIHNDFKLDNLVLSPDDPTEIIGVLDWEMATVGDPLMDLGASLAYWVQADDSQAMKAIKTIPTTVPGMMTREEVMARYARRSGRQIEDFTFYYVYGLFRLAGIAQQIYKRYTLGQTKNPRFKGFGQAVGILIQQAQKVIRESEAAKNREQQLATLLTSDAFRLDGKVAVITGSSRGIGESVARLFANQGAHVVVSSRNFDSCEGVAASIRENGGKATAIACHVGEAEARASLITQVEKEFGRLDILINNAATNPYFGHILDTPTSAAEKTIDVNIAGFFHLSQLAGRVMREQGSGVIINTASVNGVKPAQYQGIYSITKGAIITMTQAFAKECAQDGIRVNAVLPGLTETKFASALTENEALLKTILPLIPQGRVADPAEIAPAFLFLASPASSYVTGISLTVDGGLLA
ncbi:MAG: SDR family oxidoreductase [Candidatus Eremiobacteraeota bacterium]|nr:SDR family oxidoreductase [Candidatus Eremiobacteraeota bacterium]